MGDTGSLIIGFIIGVSTIRLLGISTSEIVTLPFEASKLHYLIAFILFVPSYDVFRVIFLRLCYKKPIFSADRNHLHHIISDFGLSHRRTSVFSGMVKMIFIYIAFLIAFYLQKEILIAFLIALVILVSILLLSMNSNHYAKRTKVILRKPFLKLNESKLKTSLLNLFF